jgi:hypothetical protein
MIEISTRLKVNVRGCSLVNELFFFNILRVPTEWWQQSQSIVNTMDSCCQSNNNQQ